MDNLNMKFMREIGNIKDPVIFLGIATTLNVKVYTDEKDEEGHLIPKDFSVIFKEIMTNYNGAGRKLKRDLLKVLRDANKEKVDMNATRTENTEAPVQNQEMQ